MEDPVDMDLTIVKQSIRLALCTHGLFLVIFIFFHLDFVCMSGPNIWTTAIFMDPTRTGMWSIKRRIQTPWISASCS